MIARPNISQNEWKTAEIGASEVGNFALLCCPERRERHADAVDLGAVGEPLRVAPLRAERPEVRLVGPGAPAAPLDEAVEVPARDEAPPRLVLLEERGELRKEELRLDVDAHERRRVPRGHGVVDGRVRARESPEGLGHGDELLELAVVDGAQLLEARREREPTRLRAAGEAELDAEALRERQRLVERLEARAVRRLERLVHLAVPVLDPAPHAVRRVALRERADLPLHVLPQLLPRGPRLEQVDVHERRERSAERVVHAAPARAPRAGVDADAGRRARPRAPATVPRRGPGWGATARRTVGRGGVRHDRPRASACGRDPPGCRPFAARAGAARGSRVRAWRPRACGARGAAASPPCAADRHRPRASAGRGTRRPRWRRST